MKNKLFVLALAVAALMMSACASQRMNLSYDASQGEVQQLPKTVTGAVIPLEDVRKDITYPKQVIKQTSYNGDVTYDINDKSVEDVMDDALVSELGRMGVKAVRTEGIQGPLDKETADRIRKRLAAEYPDVQVAFGGRITDFMASSTRTLVTDKVHIVAAIQFYVLDVKTGDLLWSDYKAEWDNTVASVNHDYMIKQLNEALTALMHKTIRDNTSLRDLLVKISNR